MATATLKLNMTAAALVDSRTPDATHPLNVRDRIVLHRNDDAGEGSRLYMKFEAFSSSLKRKKLLSILRIAVDPYSGKKYFAAGTGDFDKNTLTWNNKPEGKSIALYHESGGADDVDYLEFYNTGWTQHEGALTVRERSERAKEILKYSTLFLYPSQSVEESTVDIESGYFSSSWHFAAPYIYVRYDNGADLTSQITPLNNKDGYVNPDADQTFKWDFVSADSNYVCAGDFAQASASFFWKEHSSGAYTEVQASGSTKSVTIPAETFPADTLIDWYVSGTDEDGTSTSSSVYTVSTSDSTANTSVISPLNAVEDGNGPITFRWNLSNDYGNNPSLVELLWKLPTDNDWTTIVSTADPITQYTTAAGYFAAGEIIWGVRAYNQDNVLGPESTGSFICVAAPEAPNGITSNGVPFATISWQCNGQQAYRIIIDGTDYGVKFGTEKSFTLQEPLEDGDHTVGILAQGVYGLWSQAGTAVISIENQSGEEIALEASGELDANLAWSTEEATQDFFVYRDDKKIGHTNRTRFTDMLALGNHSYYVINRLPDGNYSKSNSASVLLETTETMIAEYPSGSWMNVRLRESNNAKIEFNHKKSFNTRHYYGAEYPVAEMSPFADVSGSYDASFIDVSAARQFESLKGKLVCIKSKTGIVFVGVINTMRKSVGQFYISYSINVTGVHWSDYIDDTTN